MFADEQRAPESWPPREVARPCPSCKRDRPELNGEFFRLRRRLANVTLKEMARLLGCSFAHVSFMERGIRPFLAKHADAYDRIFERRSGPARGRSPRHGRV